MAATKKEKHEKAAAAILKTPEAVEFSDAADELVFRIQVPVPRRVGRPTVMTAAALAKLEYAFKIGCADHEACLFAGVSVDSLQRYFDKHPEYRVLSSAWKDAYLVMFARANIAAAITGNVPKGNLAISQDYLRAKRKDEFAEKNITEHQAALTPDEIERRNNEAIAARRSAIEGEIVAEGDHSPALPYSEGGSED